MPALIDLRRRIKSVRNTQQITQAMKSVATAKLKKAQRTILEKRPFWHNYPDLLSMMASWADSTSHPLLEKREERKILGIVITSDKGLCGAFNSNLLEKGLSYLEKKASSCEIRLVLIGKKAVGFFKKQPFPIVRSYPDQIQDLSREDFNDLSYFIMRLYVLRETDAVYGVYNEFKSILAPRITVTQLLPFEPLIRRAEEEKIKAGDNLSDLQPIWEPGTAPLLNTTLPLYVESQVLHFFFESVAAEHAARMMAMDNATKNAGELIDDLTLLLNKIRQASITKELLEIISTVEALEKK